jgi:DNA-binding transcriptional MocR family regulator
MRPSARSAPQQALDLLSRIFIDPGDVVLAEGPSYVETLVPHEANVVHVAMGDQGLILRRWPTHWLGWPPPVRAPPPAQARRRRRRSTRWAPRKPP